MKLMVKSMLKEQGKTIYWLAQNLGTSWQNAEMMVSGKTKSISYERIDALCQLFNCTPNDLFGYNK